MHSPGERRPLNFSKSFWDFQKWTILELAPKWVKIWPWDLGMVGLRWLTGGSRENRLLAFQHKENGRASISEQGGKEKNNALLQGIPCVTQLQR